jgi:protein-disulfide isomerase
VSGKVKASTDPKLAPAFGPKKSKVHVTVISDFQCPVCRRAVEATHQIAEEWPGEVRVTFSQHPLKMHKNAEGAAAASLAAHKQGKFWDFHDVLFQNQRALDRLSLFAYAERMGLDMNRFKTDFESASLRTRIQGESAMAEALGARGTPAFLINGKISVGWGSWNGFRGQVLRELKQVNAMLAQGTKQDEVIVARAEANAKDKAAFKVYAEGVLKPLGLVK